MPWRKYKSKKGKYGNTYFIAKGVWVRKNQYGKWLVFFEKNGHRRNFTIGFGKKGLRKAIKAAEAIAAEINSIDLSNSEKPSETLMPDFKSISQQWFRKGCRNWNEFTIERYEQVLRDHIWPYECFKKKIDQISKKAIRDHLDKLYDNLSPASIEIINTVISGIFKEAMADELISANPASEVLKGLLPKKNKRNVKDAQPFNIAERDLFLAKAAQICCWAELLILKVMVHAGLRLGEVLAMRVSNFYPEREKYRVAESFKRKGFNKPKAGKIRFVDFPPSLVKELEAYISQLKKQGLKQGRGGHVDLLFIDPKENGPWPYSQRKIQGLMHRVCKAAGLQIRNPHDLRHTYASILLMAHKSPAYVKKQLGHSTIDTTVDIYGHWIDEEGRDGLEDALKISEAVPNPDSKSHIIAYKPKRFQ